MDKNRFQKKESIFKSQRGFTLVELITVVSIIGIIATISIIRLMSAREGANVGVAMHNQGIIKNAITQYYNDMGFYPPDVNRGWDPGFVQPMPSNPDVGTSDPPVGGYVVPGTNCSHCPANWQTLIQNRWAGPYLPYWPRFTPWNGKYDYNYWGAGAVRFGCPIPPGIYVGIQGNYVNTNRIPEAAEEKMLQKATDSDNCINTESQMILIRL